jgi:Mg/Co/Ni transporter MgtE
MSSASCAEFQEAAVVVAIAAAPDDDVAAAALDLEAGVSAAADRNDGSSTDINSEGEQRADMKKAVASNPGRELSSASLITSLKHAAPAAIEEYHDASTTDADDYNSSGVWRRAFPERYLALLVTLALEIPVTLIVGGGSKDLVERIGLDRYTLLVAFLPLTSAIAGNVGLQASSLTTRAIALGHCTPRALRRWLLREVGAAVLLALACGLAVTIVASIWSTCYGTSDLGFAITIGFAQIFSITIAGFTGSIAPLLFSFLVKSDPGKWAGPMETAVQDIAGAFAVVYIAQYMLLFFVGIGVSPPAPQ